MKQTNKRPDTASARKMSKDPVKGIYRREKLYEAVANVLLKHRSGTFTLDDVAAEMGMSKAAVYYYFRSKGDMLYSLTMYLYHLMHKEQDALWEDKSLTPRERLVAIVRAYLAVNVKHWKVSRVLWYDNGLREASAAQAGVINRERRQYRNRINKLVNEIVADEGLDPIDGHTAAWFIYGILTFTSVWFMPGKGMSTQEIGEFANRLIFKGIFSKSQHR